MEIKNEQGDTGHIPGRRYFKIHKILIGWSRCKTEKPKNAKQKRVRWKKQNEEDHIKNR